MPKPGKHGRGKGSRDNRASRERAQPQSASPIDSNFQSGPGLVDQQIADGHSPNPGLRSPSFGFQPQSLNVNTAGPPAGKVAIPPLRTHLTTETFSKTFKKGRTAHACDNCRKAKAGCTGGQPCSRCRAARVACVYGDGKRDREKKEMSKLSRETINLSRRNTELVNALRRIRQDSGISRERMRAAIDDILAMNLSLMSPNDRDDSPNASRLSSEPEENEDSEEQDDLAETGSTGSLDLIDFDADRDETRATGHLGKTSSVSWAKRTAEEYRDETGLEVPLSNVTRGVHLSSYYTEDADVEYLDTSNVNMYSWPDQEVANHLLNIYFAHVHDAFPLLDKADFLYKYRVFNRLSITLSLEDTLWLGNLNCIFAIAAVHSHLTKNTQRGHYNDHLVYCGRARMLWDQQMTDQDARVSTTCAFGLLCLYYLAWSTCGVAIRHALALGLHVRCEVADLSDVEKEHRIRLWWCLYSLECSLNELTGRPACIADRDISTPLPINVNEDDFRTGINLYEKLEDVSLVGTTSRRGSRPGRPAAIYQVQMGLSQSLSSSSRELQRPTTSSTYFIYRTQLLIISREIVTHLYSAATVQDRWSKIESTIDRIDNRLVAWANNLPPEFNVSFDAYDRLDVNDPNAISRAGLAMLFNSSRMILFRPCLCRFDGKTPNRFIQSKSFIREAARKCIYSARRMISLISYSIAPTSNIYLVSPWWSTLHYICQALAILTLEMAFRGEHLPDEVAEVLEAAKKAIRWLVIMSGQSTSARKAWEIFDCLIRHVAPMISWSVFDLPTEAPVPPGYFYQRFNTGNASAASFPPRHPHQPPQMGMPFPGPSSSGGPSTWVDPDSYAEFTTGFSSFTVPQSQLEAVGNPLNQDTAAERFQTIGQVHGHYDHPWRHIFNTGSEKQKEMLVDGTEMLHDHLSHDLGMDGTDGFGGHGFQ